MREQTLTIFLGTLPLIVTLLGGFIYNSLILKDILNRLTKVEDKLSSLDKRVAVLESRTGLYKG